MAVKRLRQVYQNVKKINESLPFCDLSFVK